MLGNPIGHDDGIQDLLICFCVHLDPSYFLYRHRILLSSPNRLRGNAIPGDNGHHNGKAQVRRSEVRLKHESKALTAGRGKGPGSGKTCPLQDRKDAVLTFHIHQVGRKFPFRDEFGQMFCQGRLRCDGIDRHHIRFCQTDSPRCCLIAIANNRLRHLYSSCSSTMVMA